MTPDALKPKTAASKEEKAKTRKTPERAHVLEVSGLCVNCHDAESCMYRKTSSKPIQFCEEFRETGPGSQTMFRQVTHQPAPRQEPKVPDGLKGLCVNCDYRDTCTHAKAEGGVWHCEEYR
jgi:hypothetical protein